MTMWITSTVSSIILPLLLYFEQLSQNWFYDTRWKNLKFRNFVLNIIFQAWPVWYMQWLKIRRRINHFNCLCDLNIYNSNKWINLNLGKNHYCWCRCTNHIHKRFYFSDKYSFEVNIKLGWINRKLKFHGIYANDMQISIILPFLTFKCLKALSFLVKHALPATLLGLRL